MIAALLIALMITDGGWNAVSTIPIEPQIVETQDVITSKPLVTKHTFGTCTITHYCGCSACCGAWGNNTASGAKPTAGWTVANNVLPFGTKVEINGHVYCVEDRGDSRMNDFWFDIYCDGHQEALDRGMYQAEVFIIDE